MKPSEKSTLTHTVKLTEYSHGAGCGCKIAPEVLDRILGDNKDSVSFPSLMVGNGSRDDAAVMDMGNGTGIISTTDFFMPIVDDPFSFGQIAATNAISDIYAMGGKPLMAVAILGWPVNKLDAGIAANVIDGGRFTCHKAGIPLAGGHSIDAPEPIFGLAVTGVAKLENIRKNSTAKAGDLLFLTKPLGVGILSTAQKQKKLLPEHADIAAHQMKQLNQSGTTFATLPYVHAMTDVTGFGLLGHLLEICNASQLSAHISTEDIPILKEAEHYRASGCIPGGARRNHASYGQQVSSLSEKQKAFLYDPQTSGGLLITVNPAYKKDFLAVAKSEGLYLESFGKLKPQSGLSAPVITVL